MSWYDWWRWSDRTPPNPPIVSSVKKEQIMRFQYTFTLAAPSESVTRMATVTIDGVESQVTIENNQLVLDLNKDSVVSVSFVDTDTAGNSSEPTMVLEDVIIVDNVAPSAPNVTLDIIQLPDEPVVDTPPTDGDVPPVTDTPDTPPATDAPDEDANGDTPVA